MIFDAYAALRKLETEAPAPATTATFATNPTENARNVAIAADVAGVHVAKPKNVSSANETPATELRGPYSVNIPDTDAFEERAAICEYDGGLTRDAAEDLAARCQGYNNVIASLRGKRPASAP